MAGGNKIGGKNPGARGRGRPKGSPNKTTAAVKDMILAALDKAGGEDYLLTQSEENPTAFLTLIGKVLPLDVNNNHSGSCRVIHVPVPKTALDQ